jgi:hypothetical protein
MLSAAASRAAKDRGQQLAIDFAGEGWKERVLVELEAWCAMRRAQGHVDMQMEQFRAVAVNHPASTKAWGTLPAIACKAGILAPLTHPDGSPVMRFAESVKTHRHPVRAWALASASFAAPSTAQANSPWTHFEGGEPVKGRTSDVTPVGNGLPRLGDGCHG